MQTLDIMRDCFRIAIVSLILCLAALGQRDSDAWIAQLDGKEKAAATSATEAILITFAVAEGTQLRKTFTRELELTTRQNDSLVDLGAWRA